ncbi:YnbE family lipoprotein [Tatumella morbirosei]|uniref:YnbE family lipoprotein n=1 Tax=Tatumella morbirosei TaxID=642227 RepID=UPI0012EED0FF|nr:YnbE family lipoprotein [Tatumella morbirosei]
MVCLGPAFILSGCIPRIEVAAPKEPITIDMNVKIEHQITVKADKDVQTLLDDDKAKTNQQQGGQQATTGTSVSE